MPQTLLSPIAEYRGVCIIERNGDVPREWNGVKYTTDGKVYLALDLKDPDHPGLMAYENERKIKELLDQLSDYERSKFYSLKRFWGECLRQPSRTDAVPEYEWDDAQGRFVTAKGVKDGMRRIRDMRGWLRDK